VRKKPTKFALSLGRNKLAQSELKKIPKNHFIYPNALTLKAFTLLQNHKNKKANNNNSFVQFALGLSEIRLGNLEAGRALIELAVLLDPSNSIYRSYLGKAYSEELRSEEAMAQFELAKILDPNDPTPWFYAGVAWNNENQFTKAIREFDVSQSINGSRGIYRSKMALNQDFSLKSSNIAKAYSSLGFGGHARTLGAEIVSTSPDDFSGHLLLAKSYASDSRSQGLVASEYLQAVINKPHGAPYIPVGLYENDSVKIARSNISELGLGEYSSLFLMSGTKGYINYGLGTDNTVKSHAGMQIYSNQLDFGVSHYSYETDGFRENSDADFKIGAAILGWSLNEAISLQAEFIERYEDIGDLQVTLDETLYSPFKRKNIDSNYIRLTSTLNFGGLNFLVSSRSTKTDFESLDKIVLGTEIFDNNGIFKEEKRQYDIKALYSVGEFYVVMGANESDRESIDIGYPYIDEYSDRSLYLHSNFVLHKNLKATVGVEDRKADSIEIEEQVRVEVNEIDKTLYKAGLKYELNHRFSLTVDSFETYISSPEFQKTFMPTHIFYTPQVFDGPRGILVESNGLNLVSAPADNVQLGVGVYDRFYRSHESNYFGNYDNELGRAYINWTLTDRLSFSSDIKLMKFEFKSGSGVLRDNPVENLERKVLKLSGGYTLSSNTHVGVELYTVRQKYNFLNESSNAGIKSEASEFIDIFGRLELVPRRVFIKAELKNLLDQEVNLIEVLPFYDHATKNLPVRSVYMELGLYL